MSCNMFINCMIFQISTVDADNFSQSNIDYVAILRILTL